MTLIFGGEVVAYEADQDSYQQIYNICHKIFSCYRFPILLHSSRLFKRLHYGRANRFQATFNIDGTFHKHKSASSMRWHIFPDNDSSTTLLSNVTRFQGWAIPWYNHIAIVFPKCTYTCILLSQQNFLSVFAFLRHKRYSRLFLVTWNYMNGNTYHH